MKCPFCGHDDTGVVDSRETPDQRQIRRRRECKSCGERFTTYEAVEEVVPQVVKKDGRRESWDKQKLRIALRRACAKRPVSEEQIETSLKRVQDRLFERYPKEIRSREIGEALIEELQLLDPIAYLRFASVYREFDDPRQFVEEVNRLLGRK